MTGKENPRWSQHSMINWLKRNEGNITSIAAIPRTLGFVLSVGVATGIVLEKNGMDVGLNEKNVKLWTNIMLSGGVVFALSVLVSFIPAIASGTQKKISNRTRK